MARTLGFGRRVSTGAQEAATLDREEIARVAYGLFERRGGTHGSDQRDWFEAERILRQHRRSSGNGQ